MLTIKNVIDNFTYLSQQPEVGEDSYILMDWHIPVHYGLSNQEFQKAVNSIDPEFTLYASIEEKLEEYAQSIHKPANQALLDIADALQGHPTLGSISEAIRRVL